MVRVELQLHPDEAELLWQALGETLGEMLDERKGRLRGDSDAENVPAETSPPSPTLADAAVAMAEQTLASAEPTQARPASARRLLFVHLREDHLQAGPDAPTWRAELHDGTELSSATLLRVACDSAIIAVKTDAEGHPLDIGRKRRSPSAALMRALQLRDRHCSFPGCASESYLEAHHLEHWARGGDTSLSNLTILCGFCHTLLHEGGFSARRGDDGELCFFEPATARGSGRRIVPVPAPPQPDGALTDAAIDRRTSLPDWDGRPLELPAAVGALLGRDTQRHNTQGHNAHA